MDSDRQDRIKELEAQFKVLNRAICLMLDDYANRDQFLEQVVSVIREELEYDHFVIAVVDAEGRAIYRSGYGLPEEWKGRYMQAAEVGVVGWVLKHGEPLLVPDVSCEPRYVEGRETTRSEVCVPLRVRGCVFGVINAESDECVFGVINAESDEVNRFTAHDLELLTTLAAVVSGTLAKILRREEAARWEAQKLLDLTARERQVLQQIAEGKTNRQIAQQLKIAERTVETHITRILGRLGMKSRFTAALWWREHGSIGENK